MLEYIFYVHLTHITSLDRFYRGFHCHVLQSCGSQNPMLELRLAYVNAPLKKSPVSNQNH